MTPKEKAKEIYDKMMYYIMYNCQPTLSEMVAKKCALIAINEILKDKEEIDGMRIINDPYWLEVKQEIEKL